MIILRVRAVGLATIVVCTVAGQNASLPGIVGGSQVASEHGINSASDWMMVQKLISPPKVSSAGATQSQVIAERDNFTQSSRKAAQTAKQFYTDFPNDINAGEAKKIEAIQGLQGVLDNDATQELSAQQVAATFRDSKSNDLEGRVAVAVLAERVKNRAKMGGIFVNNPGALENIADTIRVEFGDVDPVFRFYASIVRSADMATAKRISLNLLKWPTAADIKREAQAALDLDATLNQNFDVNLTRIDGKIYDSAKLKGKYIIYYVWTPGASGPNGLAKYKKQLSGNVEVVYVSLSASPAAVQAQTNNIVVPGTVCNEAMGPSVSALQKLHIRHTPYVFVVGPEGKLLGFGPVAGLGSLMATINPR